jgi:Flp pilus assembly pilin Flp
VGAEDQPASQPSRENVIEYLLIVALIVLVAIGTLLVFSTQLSDILAWISADIHSQ